MKFDCVDPKPAFGTRTGYTVCRRCGRPLLLDTKDHYRHRRGFKRDMTMATNTVPIDMEGYDVFGKLAEWTEAQPDRRAEVSTIWLLTCVGFAVRLSWVSRGQLWNIRKVATSAQEATELAFKEFDRHEHSGEHDR